jgi:alpha-glucosidase
LTLGKPGRWLVPSSVLPGISGVERREKELLLGNKNENGNNESGGGSAAALEVEVVSSPSFAAVVRRKNENNSSSSSSSSVLLDTRGFRLVFKDRYIELTTRLPNNGKGALYGLGERTSSSEKLPLRRNNEGVPFTLWTRDAAAADADQNSYG